MKPPISQKEERQFICVKIYYRDIWARLLHILFPLTNKTPSKVKF